MAPTRSQSVGSLMEFTNPAEKRIKDLINEETPATKRKLETTVSTNVIGEGLKRREKIIKENTVADITIHGTIHENASMEDASMSEALPLDKSLTRTISPEMDVETIENVDPSLQGAACKEIIEDSKKETKKQPVKVKKTPTEKNATLEKTNVENVTNNVDKENVKTESKKEKVEEKSEVEKTPTKKKMVKKKVLADKNENTASKTKVPEVVKDSEASKVEVPKAEEASKETKEEEEKAKEVRSFYYL